MKNTKLSTSALILSTSTLILSTSLLADPINVTAIPPPPRGTSLLSASDATLDKWHAPPRPTDPEALKMWTRTVTSPGFWNREEHPTFTKGILPMTATLIQTSGDPWSGMEYLSTSGAPFAKGRAVMDWYVPAVTAPTCNGVLYAMSQWDGIGATINSLPQAGVQETVYCSGVTQHATYKAIYQWLPSGPIYPSSPVMHAGDSVDVWTWCNSSTVCWAYWENYTTSTSLQIQIPYAAPVDGTSLEWINERNVYGSAPNFTTFSVQAYGYDTSGNLYTPGNYGPTSFTGYLEKLSATGTYVSSFSGYNITFAP